MIFTSPEFLFLFLPFVIILYYLLSYSSFKNISKWFLALSSIAFYGIGSPDYFFIFLCSIILNFIIGTKIARSAGKRSNLWILLFGVLLNLWLLGYYKYFNFILQISNIVTGLSVSYLDIILPIGISFYTFQLIAYLIDSYKGQTGNYKFIDYLLFISFFPQLIVGPIVHHSEVLYQFEDINTGKINYENLSKGIFLFFLGATKKIVLADPLTQNSQLGFDHLQDLSFLDSWSCALGYTISYYFDLSGYADMAIGLGLLFNIKIPLNFDSPYKAQNFADYWRRWHMTLSKFLGDYIFRSIYSKGDSSIKFYSAIMVTFFISGIWHGAGFNFIVWGILNGILVCISHFIMRKNLKIHPIVGWCVTFFFVIIMRVFFVSKDLSSSFYFLEKMFSVSIPIIWEIDYFNEFDLTLLLIGFFIAVFFPNSQEIMEKFQFNWKFLILNLFFVFIVIGRIGISNKFLYFQF